MTRITLRTFRTVSTFVRCATFRALRNFMTPMALGDFRAFVTCGNFRNSRTFRTFVTF